MILFESFNKSFSCGEINKKYSLLEIFTDLYVVIFSCAINCFLLVFRVKYFWIVQLHDVLLDCSIQNSDKYCAWHARLSLKIKLKKFEN